MAMNFTTNRVQPEQIGEMPSDFHDFTESPSVDDYPYSRLELACDTFRLFRNNGFSRWESLRHFFKSLKGSA
jgi:hypothetical protein